MCGAVRSFIDGFYVYINDGNVSSFCTHVQNLWPDVLSQSIYVELVVSMICIHVEASCFVQVDECMEFLDDVVCAI